MWKNPVDEGIAYIIEPCDGGVLYKYLDGEPLEKLPFTMKDIVHRARMDDDVIFVGDKVTVVFALDPRNGKVLRKFTLQDSISERHRLPPHTIYIARNEYTVHISDERSNMHWQLAYSEYEPNAMNWNENIDMGTSDVYVAPDANADITAINRTSVAVYDVYMSMDYAIVLSEQRAPTKLDHGTIGEMLHSLKMRSVNKFNSDASAYVGIHDGALYAMSVKHYPLVQLADWSFQYTKRYPGDISRWIDASETDVDNGHWCSSPWKGDCMTGLHNISITAVPVPVRPDTSPDDTKADHATSASSSGTRPDYRHLDYHREGFFYEGLGRFWKLYLLIILGTAYVHRARCHDLYSTHVLPIILKLFKKIQSIKKKLRSTSPSANNKRANKKKPASKPSMTMTKQSQDTPDASDATISASSSATSSPAMPLNKEKDTKPLPALPVLASRSDDAVPGASLTSGGTTTTHINGSGGGGNSSWTMVSKTGMDLQRFQAATPSTILSISDSVLGYGSHGTVVYKGTFDGRAVAVKRLLIDFYDVAYQEVKLLQESDDHPNVIRYFYKEETDRFLYIALELCLGSLQDCIDRVLPVAEMKLVDHMDPADVLRQMTLGIQHLHSLKIVHRDLKPQNILIAPSKKHLQSTSPLRVLISDFGLCKKLDGDQSSFHYTAASPAGTSGWRAPELLAGALAASISGTSSTSASESSSSALANADSLDPNRIGRVKATRAIDIFSGGCIFYYVLTGGDHPFGNRFGRESNILNGTHDLTKLEGMGEDGMEAMDLIQSMIDPNPKAR
ncbi:kinase-like domain-containing protein [Gongronella butleri]|nr:kinase-like domain-containing protein [Gongronella butleri]